MTIGVDSIQVTVSSPVNCDRWLDEIEIATSEGDATDPLQLELQNEVKRLRNEANISEVELEEMSTDLINLQQQLQAANEFNTELQKKQLSTTTASKPNHSLRLRRSTSVSSRKPSLETVSELKEVDSLKAAIKKHKSNLERERLRSQSLSADGSALSVELEKTKKQLSNTREKNVILTDENNRLQKKMSGRWGDEHRNRYEEIISNERLARDRDKEFHSLEIEEEKTTQRELMLHNETLQSTVKLYKGNLQKLSTEFQDLQQSLAKRIDSRTENTSGIIQLKATLKLYEQSIETASTECSKLRERVEDQQQQLDNNDQTLQQLTSQAADKDNEIEHLRIRLNSCSCGANVQQTKHLSVDDKTNTSDKEIDQLRLILSLKEESEQDLRLENSSLLERFNSVSGKYNDLVSSQQKGGDEELLVKSNKEIDRLRLALSIREEAEESFRIENASLVERLNSVSKKKDINPSVSSEVARQLPAIPKLSGWKIPGVITYESGGRKSFTSEGDPFDITDAITTDHQKEITSLQEQLTTATRSIDMYKSKLSSTHRDLQTRDQQAGCLDKQLTAALIKVEESETNLRLLQTEDRNSEYRSEREVRELKQKLSDQDRLIDDSTKKSTAERIELEKKIAEISQQKSNAEYNLQLITEKMARSGKPRNDIRSRPPTGRPLQQEQQIVSNSSISRIDSSYEMNSSMGVGGGLLKSESLLSDLGYLRASPPPPPTRDPSVETQAGETSSVSRTLLQPSSQSVSPLLLPGMDVHSADGPAVLVERYSGSDQRLRSRDCWWARLPNGEEKLRAATELTPMSLKRSGDLNSETIIILSDDQSPDVLHVGRSETPPFASALG